MTAASARLQCKMTAGPGACGDSGEDDGLAIGGQLRARRLGPPGGKSPPGAEVMVGTLALFAWAHVGVIDFAIGREPDPIIERSLLKLDLVNIGATRAYALEGYRLQTALTTKH